MLVMIYALNIYDNNISNYKNGVTETVCHLLDYAVLNFRLVLEIPWSSLLYALVKPHFFNHPGVLVSVILNSRIILSNSYEFLFLRRAWKEQFPFLWLLTSVHVYSLLLLNLWHFDHSPAIALHKNVFDLILNLYFLNVKCLTHSMYGPNTPSKSCGKDFKRFS